jgi:predicted transposase YbfD/YdcC
MTTPLSTQTAALEQAHGRFDGRGYHVISAGELAARFADWDGLQSQGMAISYCIEKNQQIAIEQRYFISSKVFGRDEFARAVRGHWAIENELHWGDVTLGEDASPIYREDAAENLGVHWFSFICKNRPIWPVFYCCLGGDEYAYCNTTCWNPCTRLMTGCG